MPDRFSPFRHFRNERKHVTVKNEFVCARYGGDEGDRTLDLTDANRTLSQLSYAPRYEIVVGIELNRPGSQLSYAPMTRPL